MGAGGLAMATVEAGPAGAERPAPVATFTWADALAGDHGAPIAEASPTVAELEGGPSVVVGDRSGNLWAENLLTGTAVPGQWPAQTDAPIDGTASVDPLGGSGLDTVFIGAGSAVDAGVNGGYEAFSPDGTALWSTDVHDPGTDQQPAQGVQASLALGTLQGSGPDVVAGSLDQEEYALDATDGSVLTGWPFFTSDSVFSTAALADLYGTGQTEVVEGGDQSTGFANGQQYTDGGHLRIFNGRGGLICHLDTNQTVYSSPAVGGFLPGGATGAVFGTGSFFTGASDTDTVKAVGSDCRPAWSTTLDGLTLSSPALANVLGPLDGGALDVVEGTVKSVDGACAPGQGSVYALSGTTGSVLWRTSVPGCVYGSPVTADLTGAGYQDVIVTTTGGQFVLDGETGQLVLTFPPPAAIGAIGTQGSALVTNDPNGTIGVTFAGYDGDNDGVIEHFEFPTPPGVSASEAGAWPMFHHDPQLTGDAGGTPAPGSVAPCTIPAAAFGGYDLVAADGGIFSFGGQPFCGSTGGTALTAPIVGMAMAPGTGGYWLVAADGGVFAYGGAGYYGSMGGQPLNQPIVGMAATPDGRGYWLVAADGGIFSFGDAGYYGSTGGRHLNKPIIAIAATADGLGYRLVGADGGIFSFGDAQYFGSAGSLKLNQPVVGMAIDQATGGYWLVAADGGVFSFNAPFYGSAGNVHLAAPVVGVQATADGGGYRFVAADGGVFSFGDAGFLGSMGSQPLNQPIVGMGGF